MDKNSLAHTRWECKYHIVFAPKYRRRIVYQKIKADVGHILSELCKRKGIEIIAAEACPDHIHIWCRGYYVDTVGKNAKKIEEYIRNQLQEDLEYDQIGVLLFAVRYHLGMRSSIGGLSRSKRREKVDISF